MRYSKRPSRISKKSKTRKIGGMIKTQNNDEDNKNFEIVDIKKRYQLTKQQTATINKKMQELSIKFNKYMNNDTFVTKYFRKPSNKMWKIIHNFLNKEKNMSSISDEDIYNLTHDLYNIFFNILIKNSILFKSPTSVNSSDNTDNDSINSIQEECMKNSEEIRFRKIRIDKIPEGITEVYILDL